MEGAMDAGSMPREPKRRAIIFIFGAIGPLAGTLASATVYFATQSGGPVLALIGFMFSYLWVPYLVGTLPALAAGTAYAFVPRAWQRIILSPVYGAIPSAIGASFFNVSDRLGIMIIAASVGAMAALICAIIVRSMGLDSRGSERRGADA